MKINNTNTHAVAKARYKDLAIAIALSGASLLLVPTVAKADTTTSSAPATATTSAVAKTAPSTSATSTATPSASTSADTSATIKVTAPAAGSGSVSATPTPAPAPSAPVAKPEASTTAPSASVPSAPVVAPAAPSTSAPSAVTPTAPTKESTTTPTAPVVVPAAPSTSSTATPATDYTVYVTPVGLDGAALGKPVAVASCPANSAATVDWTPALVASVMADFPNSSAYTPWDPTSLTDPLKLSIGSSDVTVPIKFACKTITATYTFVDETTGKTICTLPSTFTLSGSATDPLRTNGVRAPMAVYSSTGLVADDPSTAAVTSPEALPFFGTSGDILDDSYYVLDSAKSGNTTPLAYVAWPASGAINETFYYKEATTPAVTIDAVDSNGTPLKTFVSTTFDYSLPAAKVSAAACLPTPAGAEIPGYTLTGVSVLASKSASGAPDKVLNYTGTDADYAAFLATPEGSATYDFRTMFNDYSSLQIHFEYKANVVSLMVQPVDTSGNKVGSPIPDGTGTVGQKVSIKAPEVEGYEALDAETEAAVDPDGVIEVAYKKSETTAPATSSSATTPAKPVASSKTAAPAKASAMSSKASTPLLRSVSSAPAKSSKFPQTGNKDMNVLSALGIALLGIMGLCYKKIKALF